MQTFKFKKRTFNNNIDNSTECNRREKKDVERMSVMMWKGLYFDMNNKERIDRTNH